ADLPSPLRHTWSLAVEEQFYLLWPLLFLTAIVIGRKQRRRAVAIMAALVAVASAGVMAILAGSTGDLSRLYYGTDTRIFAMAIGGLIAAFFDPLRDTLRSSEPPAATAGGLRLVGVIGIIGIMAAFVIADDQAEWMYRFGFPSIALVTGLAILGLLPGRGIVGQILSWRLLCWIGIRSYGIYLFSWPIQIFAEHRFPDAPSALRDLLVITMTVGFAALSFHLVERPVIDGRIPWRRGHRPVRRQGRVPATLASSLLAAFIVIGLAVDADAKPD